MNNSEILNGELPTELKYDINSVDSSFINLVPYVKDEDVYKILDLKNSQGKINTFKELEEKGVSKRALNSIKKFLKIKNENSSSNILYNSFYTADTWHNIHYQSRF